MYKIMFICHGNICRSPMAEFVMKHLVGEAGRAGEFQISSAAVSYEEVGNPVYPPAAAKMREKGIPFGGHRAHRITPDEAREYDLLIIMDSSNERLLKGIVPSSEYGKIHYLMEYAGFGKRNVADPWYSGDFESCYRDVERACRGLLAQPMTFPAITQPLKTKLDTVQFTLPSEK